MNINRPGSFGPLLRFLLALGALACGATAATVAAVLAVHTLG